MSRLLKQTALLLTVLFVFSGCGKTEKFESDKINIVAVNFPSYDFAREIAGECAEILMLLSPGEESHTFEPTPQDIILIQKADVFIAGGGESDAWVKRLISSSEIDKGKVLFMMEQDGINNIKASHEHFENHDHSEFYEYDEHIWTSPLNAKVICESIYERLVEIDEENKDAYKENLDNYSKKLDKLDKDFFDIVKDAKRKTLVFGDRFAFRHFADRYGLSYYSAFPGCSGETEPDAKTVKLLIDKVSKENIPIVFYKEMSEGRVADAICEATNAKKQVFHSCGVVAKKEFENGENYISLMTKNADVLKEALN